MPPQQIGHLLSDCEHSLQATRCPQGMKTMPISLSKHILHSFSLCSFCSFSSGSSSGRYDKKKKTQNIKKTHFPGLVAAMNLGLLISWTPAGSLSLIKTVFYSCLTDFLWNHCFSKMLDFKNYPYCFHGHAGLRHFCAHRKIVWLNQCICGCVYHFLLPKIHSDDPNSENKHSPIFLSIF